MVETYYEWKCKGCGSVWAIKGGFTDHDDECPCCTQLLLSRGKQGEGV